jgi:hypothetical protein
VERAVRDVVDSMNRELGFVANALPIMRHTKTLTSAKRIMKIAI